MQNCHCFLYPILSSIIGLAIGGLLFLAVKPLLRRVGFLSWLTEPAKCNGGSCVKRDPDRVAAAEEAMEKISSRLASHPMFFQAK